MFSQSLRLIQLLECTLCRQEIYQENAASDSFYATLFDHKKYSLCPNCFQSVPLPHSKGYKNRWTRRMKKIQEEMKKKRESSSETTAII